MRPPAVVAPVVRAGAASGVELVDEPAGTGSRLRAEAETVTITLAFPSCLPVCPSRLSFPSVLPSPSQEDSHP